MNKEEIVSEISDVIFQYTSGVEFDDCEECANEIYNLNYRKIPEKAVVLSEKECGEILKNAQVAFAEGEVCGKETAIDAFNELKEYFSLYSYIGKEVLFTKIDELVKRLDRE